MGNSKRKPHNSHVIYPTQILFTCNINPLPDFYVVNNDGYENRISHQNGRIQMHNGGCVRRDAFCIVRFCSPVAISDCLLDIQNGKAAAVTTDFDRTFGHQRTRQGLYITEKRIFHTKMFLIHFCCLWYVIRHSSQQLPTY